MGPESIVLAGSIPVSDVTAYSGLFVLIAGFVGAYITYRLRKRSQSGDVETSEAGALWAQTQAMISQLGAEKAKAEDQRDRLIEMQTTQVMPAMTAMNTSLKEISDELARLDGILTRLDARYGTRKVPLREIQEKGDRDGQGLRPDDP